MNLDRYSRQVILPEVGVEGQQTLLDSSVLVIGAGGLGCAALQYLAGAGVGRISIADGDAVELSNLQRQTLHAQDSLGSNKAESAAQRLMALNPDISIVALPHKLNGKTLMEQAGLHDLTLDCSDTFDTRYAVNDACMHSGKPLVSGAAIRQEGQVMLLTPGKGDSACYACVFPQARQSEERCEDTGVLGPVVGVIGSLQAMLALHWLLGMQPREPALHLLDAARLHWRRVGLRRDPDCPVCSHA